MNELMKFSQDAGEFFGQLMCNGFWLMVVISLAMLHIMMHLVVWALGWFIQVLP